MVVLVRGLLASADSFEVPGLPWLSLARYLASRGFEEVTYDQRGAGLSSASSVDFGLAEHVLVDLPAVLRFALELTGADPEDLVLGEHGFDGTPLYLQQIAERAAGEESIGPIIRGALVIAWIRSTYSHPKRIRTG